MCDFRRDNVICIKFCDKIITCLCDPEVSPLEDLVITG